jgi:glutamine synthetase
MESYFSPAEPVTVLNTIVADSLQYLSEEIEKRTKNGLSRTDAIDQVIRETLKKHYAIVFNGNGYLESWRIEAAQRGNN